MGPIGRKHHRTSTSIVRMSAQAAVIAATSIGTMSARGGPFAVNEPNLLVRADPGTDIVVDGMLEGQIDAAGELALTVVQGLHEIVGERPGFRPEHAIVEVKTATPARVALLSGLQPDTLRRSDGGGGSLIIETLPIEVTVSSARLKWQKVAKRGQPFVARDLAPGDYRVTLCTETKCVDFRAEVSRGRLRSLFVDVEQGDVEDRSIDVERIHRRARADCSAKNDPTACEIACRIDRHRSLTAASPACRSSVRRARAIDSFPKGNTPSRAIEATSHVRTPGR